MKLGIPHILLTKTAGNHYVFDVNKNVVLPVTKEVYKILRKKNTGENVDHPWINEAIKRGYLSNKRIKEIIHPLIQVMDDFLSNYIEKITLQLTQQCNFRCEYCVYSDNSSNRKHSSKRMNLETAKKGIDFLMTHSRDQRTVTIGFYGGEPLLEFELIKKCIEYTENAYRGKNVIYSITSNGSLLNKEIIEYFIEKKVLLSISLDGPKSVHDKNRKFAINDCGTFESVMERLKFIKVNYPEYAKSIMIMAVVDPETNYKCSSDFFTCDEILKGFEIHTSMLEDSNLQNKFKTSGEFLKNQEYEIFKLYLNMLDKLDNKHVSAIQKSNKMRIAKMMKRLKTPSLGELADKDHHAGPCIPGQIKLFMDTNGVFYPCERVLETCNVFEIGNVEEGFNHERIKSLLNIGKLTEKECIDCYAIRYCTICAAKAVEVNEYSNGLSREKKLISCANVKSTFQADLKIACTLIDLGYEGN